MSVAALFGIMQRLPDREDSRILQSVGLTHAAGEPEVCIVVGINTGTSTNYLLFIGYNKNTALRLNVICFSNCWKVHAGKMAPYFG